MKNNSPFKKMEPWESVMRLENNAEREKGRISDSEELRGRTDTAKKDKRMGKSAYDEAPSCLVYRLSSPDSRTC